MVQGVVALSCAADSCVNDCFGTAFTRDCKGAQPTGAMCTALRADDRVAMRFDRPK